ncbi:MAG: aspartate--tRNA ligase [Candidatus Omnitrophota bacterium]|nr:aspartate--tRNA ligase [Candidatus Omnitrophota bacterium]
MLRTHTCGELTINDVGKEITLCGWVHARRDHGKLVFIDIRDRYGLTQVVFLPKHYPEAYSVAQSLRSEFVIRLTGQAGQRPKGTENPKIATGQVEVAAKTLEILSVSETPPFEINDELDPTEEMRLAYRYLDLRRPKTAEKLFRRHKACKVIRDFMDKEGFIDVETPILTKSTPEGARDYLVPSRLNPGSFYALPQSPQLFKQILMVSGFDKYYQIAKCFRDEDLRADRQPEFTQLDIEMSFLSEEDLFSLIEKLLVDLFKALKGTELKIPFPRMSYSEAMEKYKSDKPDIRKTPDEYAFLWVLDFPLFKYNKEEKRWESEHHPFTAPNTEDIAYLDSDLKRVRSRAYDLVLNGTELGSGSIRIHERHLQEKIFNIIGLSESQIRGRFGFLLEAFRFGVPPHGGFALGLDRFLAILCACESIREVIAFPKTQKAACLLTSAPSEVDKKQLDELGIKIK